MFLYESISKYCPGRRELCLYLSVPFFHARSFKETCVFRKVLDPSQPGAIRCTYPVYVLVKFWGLQHYSRNQGEYTNIYKYFPMPRADRYVMRANMITVKKLYLSFHRQKMASVPISSAYVKQLERNSMSETKAQSNGTELAKYEKNQDIAQERRPFSSCICNVQTMLQSSLQSLPFFSSAPSEQRFKECVDRP